jgi:hypothetical protein
VREPSGLFRRTIRDTSVSFGHELCKSQNFYYGLYEGENSIVRDQARTVRPSGADRSPVANQRNPKVPSLVKFISSVLADHPGCTIGPSTTVLSDM